MSDKAYDKLVSCYESIEKKLPFVPEVALVLGSGLGGFADEMEVVFEIDYHEIGGFPVSTVPGHEGRFVFGYVEGVPVVAMKGRVHYYEGYDIKDVVLPVRLMKLMGADTLFLTNAAGGLDPDFVPGDFMMITDHIASFVPSPLIGPNMDALGVRFPDMTGVYDKEYQQIIRGCADRLDIPLKEGVYLQFTGPAYETPAEVRMARLLGASAVGMSTAVEAVAARHAGMRICGISFISNAGSGLDPSKKELTHEEVKEMADRAAPYFKRLVREIIQTIGRKA